MDDQRFAHGAALADRLGNLRDRIRALKNEENALRAEILRLHGDAPLTGARYEVVVRRGFRRSLNADALPAAIRNDPRYWTVADSCTVICQPRSRGAARSDSGPISDGGVSIARPKMPRQRSLRLDAPCIDPDDIVLIEPF